MKSKMVKETPNEPNPWRVAAGKRNRAKRRELTAEGREKLRQSALATQPWRYATGPRTPEGKARAAQNGKSRQTEEVSTRTIARELTGLRQLMRGMAAMRRFLRAEKKAPVCSSRMLVRPSV
jgi:hypothetical protein